MFGLLDIPAWMCFQIGKVFIGVAKCFGSRAFCSVVCGDALNMSDNVRMRALQIQLVEVNKVHFAKRKRPLPITIVLGRNGYSLYCGTTCLVTGTFEECQKFVSGLLFILHGT